MKKIDIDEDFKEFVDMFIECAELATESANSYQLSDYQDYHAAYTVLLATEVYNKLIERSENKEERLLS